MSFVTVESIVERVRSAPSVANGGNFDLWVPDNLSLQGNPVASDIAMTVILNALLARDLFPNGFSPGVGGRMYHYVSEV